MINRTVIILLICLSTLLLVSCTALNNPFAAKTGTRTNACAVDLTLPVELERAKFTPPEIWSQLKPCEMVSVSHEFEMDSWAISARLNYTYGDVLVYDGAMGFGVEGHLNAIGGKPTTLEGWKQFEDDKWRRYMTKRGDSEKREVEYRARNGLDCWRETIRTFIRGKQEGLLIDYHCWEPDKTHYPPLSIGGSIRYRDGKPIYDLDIDKDLIDPVFATLEVKDIKPEVYAERMAAYKKTEIKQCKGRIKYARKHRNRLYTSMDIVLLKECGYNTSKLKHKQEW